MHTHRSIASAWLLAGITMVAPVAAQPIQEQPAAYTPHAVTVPADAGYLTRDGAVQIIGNDGWGAMMEQFDALFLKTHPDFGHGFHTILKGSSVAIPGLEMGVSAFAPMGRAMWETDRASFYRFRGYNPLDIRIGYDAFGPREGRKSPPSIYLNAKNPLKGLTVEQVARILTRGNDKGDISEWEQLGLTGKWATRTIHVYGLDPASGGAASFRAEYLDNHAFTYRYEALEKPTDVLHALADDPYGIALMGFADAGPLAGAVKLTPVAMREGDPFILPGFDEVHDGKYPFPAYLHIYIDRVPGKPVDPFVKEYVRMMLSQEGQAIIAGQKDTEEGYIPLTPALIEKELKKLE